MRTDGTGTHYVQLNFEGQKPDLPVMVSANAAVTDVNRQSFASNLELLVHPSSLYVGIRSTQQYVQQGDPIDVESIVTDIDGKVVSGRPFTITATRVESQFVNGAWVETDVDPRHCNVTSSTKPVSCSIKTGAGGQYKISAVVTDDAGGRNRSELTRWVSGVDTVPTRNLAQGSATVIPNQDTYHPGDVAQLLVVAPFAKGNGLLTVSANNTTRTQSFTLVDGTAVVKVPIAGTDTHGLTVQVDVAGQVPRKRDDGTNDPTLPPTPAFASGSLPLHVLPANETLTVSAIAHDTVTKPGAHDTVDVSVKAPGGAAAAGADVAVVVVDEAVLSLTGYKLADPIAAMYADREWRAFGRLPPQQPGVGEPRRVRPAEHPAHDQVGRRGTRPCTATRASRDCRATSVSSARRGLRASRRVWASRARRVRPAPSARARPAARPASRPVRRTRWRLLRAARRKS